MRQTQTTTVVTGLGPRKAPGASLEQGLGTLRIVRSTKALPSMVVLGKILRILLKALPLTQLNSFVISKSVWFSPCIITLVLSHLYYHACISAFFSIPLPLPLDLIPISGLSKDIITQETK